MKNVVFVSEQPYIGKISDDYTNWRTEMVWMKMFDAFHIPYSHVLNKNSEYASVVDSADLIIIIPSKLHPEYLQVARLLKNKKLGIIQEGPNTFWQEWTVDNQIVYLAILKNFVDVVFCHNEYDKTYFEGLTSKPVVVLPTVHFVDEWQQNRKKPEDKKMWCFIGGNLTRWYNGTGSYLVASASRQMTQYTFPTMGRRQSDEEQMMRLLDKNVKYLPYLGWTEFMMVLNEHKFAVHLMPEIAAGSFSLNCAMLGIPCIGNRHDDTQRLCFPDISVETNDLPRAKELMNRLISDEEFYKMVSEKALKVSREQFDWRKRKDVLLKEIDEVLQ